MKTLLYTAVFLLLQLSLQAQAGLQIDTIRYRGDPAKYINLVFMGDGYTSSEQTKLRADADTVAAAFFRYEPWSHYASYFNVFVIHTVSAQSGITHPNTASDCAGTGVPVLSPSTYFGVTFDSYGIHRLTVVRNTTVLMQTLAANFPGYDQAIILSNTSYYGGAGGDVAVATMNPYSIEVAAHEIGHSFAGLADEYYAGDMYAMERPNMTQQTNTSLVKWKAWLGVDGTGIYQHCCGGASANWYKPHQNCKMGVLNAPYCPVCTETIIESIHGLVNPIVKYSPAAGTVPQYSFRLTELMKPSPNTLKITWKLDGAELSAYAGKDSIILSKSTLGTAGHILTVSVVDTTSGQRVANHGALHASTLSWTIPEPNGVESTVKEQRYRLDYFPNPAQDELHIGLELQQADVLSFAVTDMGGRLLIGAQPVKADPGSFRRTLDIRALPVGIYLLNLRIGTELQTVRFTKD